MKEIDLIQAAVSWINLAYTASQWWLTVTTALVIATFFAAKHIPAWFFAIIALLYTLTSVSVVFEVSEYSELAYSYGVRLTELRVAGHALGAAAEPSAVLRHMNAFLNYSIFVIGSFCAVAFSFVHWRKARTP